MPHRWLIKVRAANRQRSELQYEHRCAIKNTSGTALYPELSTCRGHHASLQRQVREKHTEYGSRKTLAQCDVVHAVCRYLISAGTAGSNSTATLKHRQELATRNGCRTRLHIEIMMIKWGGNPLCTVHKCSLFARLSCPRTGLYSDVQRNVVCCLFCRFSRVR